MSIRPLPDFDNTEAVAKLGRQYALREAWRDALSQLRDAVTMLNSTGEPQQIDGLQMARESVDRLEEIKRMS